MALENHARTQRGHSVTRGHGTQGTAKDFLPESPSHRKHNAGLTLGLTKGLTLGLTLGLAHALTRTHSFARTHARHVTHGTHD